MMQLTKWRRHIAVLAVLVSGGSWAAGQFRSMRDRSEVANMMQTTKTVCVGRYLVDVPAKADVQLSRQRVEGVEVETLRESTEAFRKRIAEREAAIASPGLAAAANGPGQIVEARDLRLSGMTVRTLVYKRASGEGKPEDRRVADEWMWTEVHAHKNDLSFMLSALAKGESNARLAEALLGRLRIRAENEIPPMAGFCVERGIFVDPLPQHHSESIAMHLRLPDHPDMALVFATTPTGGSEPGLIQRVAGRDVTNWLHALLRVTSLRSGEHTIAGMRGEETLERVRELNTATTYSFEWDADGVDDDPMRPNLLLRLETGGSAWRLDKPIDSSLHKDALLALWDGISSTIRPSAATRDASGLRAGFQTNLSDLEQKLP
jgi:hypothetical protein